MPQRAHRLLIPLAAFLAILPILIHGPSCGHDFDFHLLSWLEASTQFAHFGFPHWAYTPAWNAGEPRFIFYPPISWTLGGLLGLVFPWTLVPALFTWIALTLSGFTAHRLASCYANPTPALLAATLYLANPYMLFTAYERTAYAELLAAAFLPLLFQAALNLGAPRLASETWEGTTSKSHRKSHTILSIAIPIALLWLTNAPAAVMGCYALAFLTLVRLVLLNPRKNVRHPERSSSASSTNGVEGPPHLPSSSNPQSPLHLALTTTAGLLLGLTLAAFYILPAAYERKYVQVDLATTTGMTPADHFLFHRMSLSTPGFTPPDIAFHDTVVRTASLVALTLLAALTLAFFLNRKKSVILSEARSAESKNPEEAHATSTVTDFSTSSSIGPVSTTLLPLTLLIAFLLTPPSQFLWHYVPQLHFLQFPWRLCALLAVILIILAAHALARWTTTKLGAPGLASETWIWTIASLALATLLILPAWHLFHQPCDEEDNVTARVALFHSNLGTDATDEYTPADADPDALHPHNPPYWLIPYCYDGDTPFCSVDHDPPHNAAPSPVPNHFTLTVSKRQTLVLNRRAYPAWHITLNGQPLSHTFPERQDGLIAIPIPPGTDTIDLHFDETPDRITGIAVSVSASLLVVFLSVRKRRRLDKRTSI